MSGNDYTKASIIEDWTQNFEARVKSPFYDKDLHAARVGFYACVPTLPQYQAFASLTDVLVTLRIQELDAADRLDVLSKTIGTQYPDFTPEELEVIVDEHAYAWSLVYQAELDTSLENVRF